MHFKIQKSIFVKFTKNISFLLTFNNWSKKNWGRILDFALESLKLKKDFLRKFLNKVKSNEIEIILCIYQTSSVKRYSQCVSYILL